MEDLVITADSTDERVHVLAQRYSQCKAYGLSDDGIRSMLNINEQQFSALTALQCVKETVADNAIARIEHNITSDNKLDILEDTLLDTLTLYAKTPMEPDFVLKAFMVVNKAVRKKTEDARNANPNGILLPVSAVATINLQQNFVNAINIMTEEQLRTQARIQSAAIESPKMVDVAGIQDAKRFLGFSGTRMEDVRCIPLEPTKPVEDDLEPPHDDLDFNFDNIGSKHNG